MKRSYKNINYVLKKVLEKNNLDHLYYENFLEQNWTVCMEPPLSKVSYPVKFDEETGILTLKVTDLYWRDEFLKNKDQLKRKVSGKFPDLNILKIDII